MRRAATAATLLGLAAPVAAGEGDALLRDWQLSGSLSARVEAYGDAGDTTRSPFPDLGTFGFGEFDFGLTRQYSPFETFRVQAFGAVVENPYRSADDGLVLERGTITWEKGDLRVPLRLDAGDIFAFQTARTIQRGLKGTQVELQPDLGGPWRHSLVGFWGVNQATYRDVDFDDDQSFGASWLAFHPSFGTFSANVATNLLADGANGVNDQRMQTVASLAGDSRLTLGGQSVEVLGEVAFFFGDDIAGTAPDETGVGLYSEARGRWSGLPLDYGLRFEQYDATFDPNGSAVTPGRRSLNLRGGWRFDGGLSLRARSRWDRDDFQAANSRDTVSSGVTLSGPLPFGLARPVTGSADYGYIATVDQARTIDNRTHTLSLNATTGLDDSTSLRAGYLLQVLDVQNSVPEYTSQITLGIDRRIEIGAVSGSLSPSASFRDITAGNAAGEEITLALGASTAWQDWSMRANYRYAFQDRNRQGADTGTQAFTLAADWQQGRHRVGLEADYSFLDGENRVSGRPFRVAAVYTLSFDKPVGQGLFGPALPPDSYGAPEPVVSGGTIDLASLAPNSLLPAVLQRLADQGVAGGQAVIEGLIVYETAVLPAIDLRQRLGLVHEGSRFRKVVVAFDPLDPNDGRALEADLNAVLTELIGIYGRPTATFARGDFTGDAAADIARSELIRLVEWRTDFGVMRLGLPRRLDGTVRIELQHARSFRPPSHTLWSIEELR
ncbi:MAG: hypothetical protein VYB54_02170 [Pseudomonadota bacterium]|nr:hypothetical protein [Pseudomonadota bacterium]